MLVFGRRRKENHLSATSITNSPLVNHRKMASLLWSHSAEISNVLCKNFQTGLIHSVS